MDDRLSPPPSAADPQSSRIRSTAPSHAPPPPQATYPPVAAAAASSRSSSTSSSSASTHHSRPSRRTSPLHRAYPHAGPGNNGTSAGTELIGSHLYYHHYPLQPPPSGLRPELSPYPYSTSLRSEIDPALSRRIGPIASPSTAAYPGLPSHRIHTPPSARDPYYPSVGRPRTLQDLGAPPSASGLHPPPPPPPPHLPHHLAHGPASASSSTLPPPPPQSTDMPVAFRFAPQDHADDSASSSDDDSYVHDAYSPSVSSDSEDDDAGAAARPSLSKTAKGKRKAISKPAPAPKAASSVPSAIVPGSAPAPARTQTGSPGSAPAAGGGGNRPTPHTRKMPEGHIKRPPNAFMLFRSHIQASDAVRLKEKDQSNASRIAGMMWRSIPEDERAYWHSQAQAAKERHAAAHPEYKYKPAKRENNAPPRRRMKKKASADAYCADMADSILKKTGLAEGLVPEAARSTKSNSPPTAASGARNGAGSRARGSASAGAGEDADGDEEEDPSGGPPRKRARRDRPASAASAGRRSHTAAQSHRDDGEQDGSASPAAAGTKARTTANSAATAGRKNSLGYVIPPARKRSPTQKPASPALSAAAASSNGGGGASPLSTPVVAPPEEVSMRMSIPMRLRRSQGESASTSGGLQAASVPTSSPGGAQAQVQPRPPAFGLSATFFGGGPVTTKTLRARLGIGSFMSEPPISPTTIPPGGAGATTGAGPRQGADGLATFVPSPSLAYAQQLARAAAGPATAGTAEGGADAGPPIDPALVKVGEGEDADGRAENGTGKKRTKPAAFREEDVRRYAPELFFEDGTAAPADGAGAGDEDGMDDADEFAAALAAADFGGPSASGAGAGAGAGTGAAGGSGDNGLGGESGGGAKRAASSGDAYDAPMDVPSLSLMDALAQTSERDGRLFAAAASAATLFEERRRSTVSGMKALIELTAQRRADAMVREANVAAAAKGQRLSGADMAQDERRAADLKQQFLRRWQAELISSSSATLPASAALLSDQHLLSQGGGGVGTTTTGGLIRPPTTYWGDEARPPGAGAGIGIGAGGGPSPPHFFGSSSAADLSIGLGLGRRQIGVGGGINVNSPVLAVRSAYSHGSGHPQPYPSSHAHHLRHHTYPLQHHYLHGSSSNYQHYHHGSSFGLDGGSSIGAMSPSIRPQSAAGESDAGSSAMLGLPSYAPSFSGMTTTTNSSSLGTHGGAASASSSSASPSVLHLSPQAFHAESSSMALRLGSAFTPAAFAEYCDEVPSAGMGIDSADFLGLSGGGNGSSSSSSSWPGMSVPPSPANFTILAEAFMDLVGPSVGL